MFFFHSETIRIVKKFLNENKNFSIKKYNKNSDLLNIKNLIADEGYFLHFLQNIKIITLMDFFSVELIRND